MKRILSFLSILCITLLIETTALAQSQPLQNKETALAKSLSEYSYTLAMQAAEWGLPAVIMYNLRYNDALKPGAKSTPNEIWRLENITTPDLAAKAGYVTPNVNVIYGFGFLDLSQEPIILSAPDSNNRYYMIQLVDMYTNSFSYIGGVSTGYKGGKYAIIGPGWQGNLPDDVTRIDAPTRWILIQPRVHVVNEADLPEAKKVLDAITVTGLSVYTHAVPPEKLKYHYIAPNLVNPNLPVSAVDFKDPLQFWKILSAVINENPPPRDQMTALLPMFKLLDIEIGKNWNPKKVSPLVLKSMERAAKEIGPLNANLPVGKLVNGWFIPPLGIGNAQSDYYLRAIVARIGLTANIPQEAIYFMATIDSKNQPLISNKKYKLTFNRVPPFIPPGFWSLTLYDAENNYTVANPINRYALSSDDNLKINSDGTLTVYIQTTNPGKNKEANWLPSGSANKSFYLILRSYAPGKLMVDALSNSKLYAPPEVVEVQ